MSMHSLVNFMHTDKQLLFLYSFESLAKASTIRTIVAAVVVLSLSYFGYMFECHCRVLVEGLGLVVEVAALEVVRHQARAFLEHY